jgi:hypothetical protein
MLNAKMDKETKQAFLMLYNLSRPEFRLWLDLHINRWHQNAAKLFRDENRFHTLIVELGDIEPGSETLQSLMKRECIEWEGVIILFPKVDEINQILKELEVGGMKAKETDGDASFTVINCLGMFASLRIPIDYDGIVDKGEEFKRK